jgi:hypothetical protein
MDNISLEIRLFKILEILANNKGIVLEDVSEELDVSSRSDRTYGKQFQEGVPGSVIDIVNNLGRV